MYIKVIFGQRREQYEGEYAPEALDVVDEHSYDENPHWIERQLERHLANKDFVAVKIVNIDVDGDKIYSFLTKPLNMKGEVQE